MNPWMDTIKALPLPLRKAFGLTLTICIAFGLATSPVKARVSIKEANQVESYQAITLYEALAAELYSQMGQEKLALEHYQRLIYLTDDPAIAKRVTVLATATGQFKKGLETAKRWVNLAPDGLEARQYLSLLYLRNSQFNSAVQELNSIYQLVEKTSGNKEQIKGEYKNSIPHSQGLKFIGALLAAETHHDKSHQVFSLYVKSFGDKKYDRQQNLIAANLAMKAKKYPAVLSSLEFLNGLDPKNMVDAYTMKAKALQKLNNTTEAIKTLNSIKDYEETSDSTRLELVRLLVLDKQKKSALPVLEKLIEKHQKNNDLLKSLIALQIDQLFLSKADKNIQKLRLTKKYTYDADYFTGEVLEAKGYLEKALDSYNKVKGGSFLKNAHKKTIHLTRRTKGQKALDELFNLRQVKSENAKDKAYWFKLHADELFDGKKYQQAFVLYTKAIDLTPENTLYYYYRGLLNERMGKLDYAENDFHHVIKKRKNNADALNALGYMLTVNTQRLSEAKKYIKQAHAIKPNDPVIMDSLGYVLYKTGELQTAEHYLRKAFRLIKNPEVASHLISVLAESGKHQEARRIFDQMNKKYPNNKLLNNVKHYLHGI